ncbi:uroporphyrinogen-III C-methyltransferase [Acetobacter oeni]|uniref:uroporphyrinogen-III C-methyltransferase n=1 Tax=Acetobacter oeni TaxID=304077 RepID=A0A511XKP9_9PROT|nr:uroporphyrinogen-III C-methyltransferase [Acetobacter oeni]MBB3883768.1 uroporphyrin-III C-methyltransferase [Acetobacter oeni]NHO19886.1 uroporphyrinogen-III C-methyltransferase [Acetobacter oeni]GBR10338.1 uroporphyrinogen-III methylase [Acetobacter oeni LMG 21952]GEN63523.1 uroporphyrin-III C-methyltransferase [Acetobacter oeni]
MSGFVSFVSSGPGDPELLTLKAVARLQAADVILFDDLSSGPVLAHARSDADVISVGKRAGRPSPRQDSINRLMMDYATTGARVVRLKSGDAGIFGRLEEEITALEAAGIGYEIIPGVPSACAAAAAAGIPLSRRLTSRRVQFVTGHDVTGDLPEELNMAALADPDATTAVFMGKRTFPKLAARLLAAGLPGDTPALLAEAVSHPEQRLLYTTVAELAGMLATHHSSAPALILYGALNGQPGGGRP